MRFGKKLRRYAVGAGLKEPRTARVRVKFWRRMPVGELLIDCGRKRPHCVSLRGGAFPDCATTYCVTCEAEQVLAGCYRCGFS